MKDTIVKKAHGYKTIGGWIPDINKGVIVFYKVGDYKGIKSFSRMIVYIDGEIRFDQELNFGKDSGEIRWRMLNELLNNFDRKGIDDIILLLLEDSTTYHLLTRRDVYMPTSEVRLFLETRALFEKNKNIEIMLAPWVFHKFDYL